MATTSNWDRHYSTVGVSIIWKYGNFDDATHEWSESETSETEKWIVFHGFVDTLWIVNMNTVGSLQSNSSEFGFVFDEDEDLSIWFGWVSLLATQVLILNRHCTSSDTQFRLCFDRQYSKTKSKWLAFNETNEYNASDFVCFLLKKTICFAVEWHLWHLWV